MVNYILISLMFAVACLLPPKYVPVKSESKEAKKLDIIDTHVHFFDPMRPTAPKRTDDKPLPRAVLPADLKALARPQNVKGVLIVEASPLLEDNQWWLDLAEKEPFIVGVVGRIDPASDDFEKNLRRFAKNPLYRGIRISHDDLKAWLKGNLVDRCKLLVELNLVLDVNGGPDMPADVARLAAKVPKLRTVINHAANLRIDGKEPPAKWIKGMAAAAKHPNVYCKVSALVEQTGKKPAPREVDYYTPVLDCLWKLFGEDRLIFGSNWPVSNGGAPYETVVGIVQDYFTAKGESAATKFFLGNSQTAYGCRRREIMNTLGMKLVHVPSGTFFMGSPLTEAGREKEETQHEVELTKGFYLGAHEVTVGQFREFVKATKHQTDPEKDGKGSWVPDAVGKFVMDAKLTWKNPGFEQTDDHPVVNVSWDDAKAFCKWLSEKEKKTYRLPTEAEWEYACRAGTKTAFVHGEDPEGLSAVGNVADAAARAKFPGWTLGIKSKDGHTFTAPVGQFKKNDFGLYDMHGNVWEWCGDWYEPNSYPKEKQLDPTGAATGKTKVQRGGGWSSDSKRLRSAARVGRDPSVYRGCYLGFRVVLEQLSETPVKEPEEAKKPPAGLRVMFNGNSWFNFVPGGHLRPGGRNSLIVFGDLSDAIRRESVQAICHWFGSAPPPTSSGGGVSPLVSGWKTLPSERLGGNMYGPFRAPAATVSTATVIRCCSAINWPKTRPSPAGWPPRRLTNTATPASTPSS